MQWQWPVRLAGSGAANEDQISRMPEEIAAIQIVDQGLIDRRADKVEGVQILGHGKASNADLVADGAGFSLGNFCLAQLTEDLLDSQLSPDALGNRLVKGTGHAVQFEPLEPVDQFMPLHDPPPGGADHSGRSRPWVQG